MKEERYEIRFSGSGGQGIIIAALIFAEAVGVYDGKYVCQTQNYGPETRGGVSQAEIVISNQPVDYPKAIKLDLLLAMNQTSCNTHFRDLKPEGLLVVDSTFVEQTPTGRVIALPFTRLARQEVGRELAANMVALGAIGYLSQAVSLKSLEMALLSRIPKGTETMNRKALDAGIEAARKVDLSALARSAGVEADDV